MPRASWSGFLRLSLGTCPVYLAPATTESKETAFSLHQQFGPCLGRQVRGRAHEVPNEGQSA